MIFANRQSIVSRHHGNAYRYPWDWPFSKASIYNIGIGSNATFAVAGAQSTTQLAAATYNVNSASSAYDSPVWVGAPTDYAYTCVQGSDTTGPDGSSRPTAPTQQIHIPSNAAPSSGTDGLWVLFDQTQPGLCWDMNNLVTFNNTQSSAGGPTGYSFFDQYASDGSGAPIESANGSANKIGGVIRAWELDAGVIRHMLRCAIGHDMLKTRGTTYNVGIPWPEVAEDFNGPSTYTGSIYWGDVFAIPSVAKGGPNLATLGLTPGGLMLATCLQQYGAIVNDGTANSTVVFYGDQDTEGTPTRLQLLSGMATDLPTIRQYLRVLTNQSTNGAPGTVNGGGTYPPPPPDFYPSLGLNNSGGGGVTSGKLPAGFLSTSGNQIVDSMGVPVRIASIGWSGGNWNAQNCVNDLTLNNLQTMANAIAAAGFNCVRVDYNDRGFFGATNNTTNIHAAGSSNGFNTALEGLTPLQVLDATVSACATAGLKVIICHHNNEGSSSNNFADTAHQMNGLWFDSGPGTNNTDGSTSPVTTGTVTKAIFQSNWVAMAGRYAGNATVIGFDLVNEPDAYTTGNNPDGFCTWGDGGLLDLQAMYQTVGNAIQAVNPDALIICEGPQNYNGNFAGTAIAPEGDLSAVATHPVVLTKPNKVVYSVHVYGSGVSGFTPDSGSAAVTRYTANWGYVHAQGIAPVWIGEMGDACVTTAAQAYATTLLGYMAGTSGGTGAPIAPLGYNQTMGGDWWDFSNNAGGDPPGVLTSFNPLTFDTNQQPYYAQLFQPAKS